MDIEIKNVNSLPSLTWRWLKLNGEKFIYKDIEKLTYLRPRARVTGRSEAVEITSGRMENFPELKTAGGDAVKSLAESHAGTVTSIRVKAGAKLSQPLVLRYNLLADTFCADDTYIYAEPGSEAQIVIAYGGSYAAAGLHVGSVKMFAGADAKLELVELQTLGKNYVNIDDVGAGSDRGARVSIKQIELGAHKNYYGARIDLTAESAGANVGTQYMLKGDQFTDVNYIINVWGKKTESTIRSRGVLMDRAHKNLRGTLDFKQGSKGSVGNESEDVLLLDPDVVNKSLPIILCAEDDIEGNHSASIGEMDDAQLFYLRTRGLSDDEIRSMQLASRFALMRAELPKELHELLDLYEKEAYSDD